MKARADTSVDTPVNSQDWKKKYFDSLSSLEGEQQKFRAMEATLKRLAGRLCTVSLGQSPRLDEEVKKLQLAIRRESSKDELDKIITAFTDAIQSLDRSTQDAMIATGKVEIAAEQSKPVTENPPEAKSPRTDSAQSIGQAVIVDEQRIRAVLAAILAELRRDPELLLQVDALDAKLSSSMTPKQLPEVLSSISEMVGRRIQRIERAKREIEALLGQMVGRLDEISRFVIDQNQHQNQTLASSETLNTHLVGEMRAMGESVESAGDLIQIRTQVRSRLDSIGKHLQEFRERETTHASAMRVRNEQMQARVSELETEANRLNDQLKDQQRLSTLDALTKIPNRLAYEQRIEEELKRLQRFKQPTCLAVWDVDHFKRVNDTFGHSAGDRVLHAVAESLASRIRSTDFLARYGGEEFVMILSGTQIKDALRLMDEVRVGIANLKLHFRGTPLAITISSGVTALQPADLPAAAFDRADKALYQAKEDGRNRCASN